MSSENSSMKRSTMKAHSSYDQDIYRMMHSGSGVAIQCQYCPAQAFRRSKLRAEDIKQLFLMRYPVRCLRCSQRQMVSFTVAGISVPSHVKQRKARHTLAQQKHWREPAKLVATPNAPIPDAIAEEVSREGRGGTA